MAGITRRALLASAVLIPTAALAQTPAPADAVLYIIWPRDGMKVQSPFAVRFGLKNMGVTHAGDTTPNMGHHHLLVDVTELINPTEPIPSDRKHRHFGAGQTETELELLPGKHTLQLVLGDADHRPFKPIVSSKIVHITVITPVVHKGHLRSAAGGTASLSRGVAVGR